MESVMVPNPRGDSIGPWIDLPTPSRLPLTLRLLARACWRQALLWGGNDA